MKNFKQNGTPYEDFLDKNAEAEYLDMGASQAWALIIHTRGTIFSHSNAIHTDYILISFRSQGQFGSSLHAALHQDCLHELQQHRPHNPLQVQWISY